MMPTEDSNPTTPYVVKSQRWKAFGVELSIVDTRRPHEEPMKPVSMTISMDGKFINFKSYVPLYMPEAEKSVEPASMPGIPVVLVYRLPAYLLRDE